MEIIGRVLEVTFNILNTRLSFGPFSFSLLAASLAISALGIIVYFIKAIFDS